MNSISHPTFTPLTMFERLDLIACLKNLGQRFEHCTGGGDCSHEIKRHLLLGRKATTNLDSILNRDITLSTKVHIVKAMVFPGVIHGCESWTIKKAECRRIDVFKLWC